LAIPSNGFFDNAVRKGSGPEGKQEPNCHQDTSPLPHLRGSITLAFSECGPQGPHQDQNEAKPHENDTYCVHYGCGPWPRSWDVGGSETFPQGLKDFSKPYFRASRYPEIENNTTRMIRDISQLCGSSKESPKVSTENSRTGNNHITNRLVNIAGHEIKYPVGTSIVPVLQCTTPATTADTTRM
jgi:hypothetical protein